MDLVPFRPQFVPRVGNPSRVLALLDAIDAARYHDAVRPVARAVDGSLGPRVLADRLAAGSLASHGHDWLVPWHPALVRLRARAHALAVTRPVVVRADVADCFGSMDAEAVGRALAALGSHPSAVGGVLSVLEALTEAGVRGLPVGPPASTVLANAVLRGADQALAGVQHLRWVDDFFIFLTDEREAPGVLLRLEEALGACGLRLAVAKTSIGSLTSAAAQVPSGVGVGSPGLQSQPT